MSNLFSIGLINTIRMNIKYFGIKSLFHPIILASRNLKIVKLDGSIISGDHSVGAIKIGFGQIGIIDRRFNRAIWENSGEVEFKGKAYLGPGTRIVCKNNLCFGKNTVISGNCDIICLKKISIGDDFLMSWESLIMDGDFHSVYDITTNNRTNQDKEINIGNHVWIGCRSTILKGSNIKNNTVIGACSMICGNLDEGNSIYRNNKCLKKGVNWSVN